MIKKLRFFLFFFVLSNQFFSQNSMPNFGIESIVRPRVLEKMKEKDCASSGIFKVLNNSAYKTNVNLTSKTANPTAPSINNLASYKTANMDFSFEAKAPASFSSAGIQIRTNSAGVKDDYLYMQGLHTDFKKNEVLTYVITFSQLVTDFKLNLGGLDYFDTARFEAFNDGQAVSVSASNFDAFGTGVELISSNEVQGAALVNGSGDFRVNDVRFSMGSAAIDEIRISAGKGPTRFSIVTLAIYDLDYCLIASTTDYGIIINTRDLSNTTFDILANNQTITDQESGNQNSEVFVDLGRRSEGQKIVIIDVKPNEQSAAQKIRFSVNDAVVSSVEVFINGSWLALSPEFYSIDEGKISFLNQSNSTEIPFTLNLINGVEYDKSAPLIFSINENINVTGAILEIIAPNETVVLNPNQNESSFTWDGTNAVKGSYQFILNIQGKSFKGNFLVL